MVENSTADVVVIGGDIVGCTAAYYLARRGASVILCEKGDVGLGHVFANPTTSGISCRPRDPNY